MKYSALTQRIGGDSADAWKILYRAAARKDAGEDIVILSIGDPDFDTPSPIVEGAVTSLRNGDTHYAEIVGDLELREIIAKQHSKATGVSAHKDQVVVMNGAQCALFSAIQCILDPGSEIIIPEPMYTTYEALVHASGAHVVSVSMRAENKFQVVPQDIEKAITDKTKAILLNSPNNPTGAVFPKETMQAIADICIKHDLWLVSDEVYSSVTFGEQHFSPCALDNMAERTITINSLSKSHAMSGWRLGWLVGPVELAEHLGNLALCMLFGCPAFIQEAAKVALTENLAELENMRATYQRRRDTLYALLKEIQGVDCHLPAAGMFLMLDIRETQLNSQQFSDLLLDKFDVAVLPGSAFGPSTQGHVRLSLGVSEKELIKAAERIRQCVSFIKEQRANG